jgi:hypothetical protein
MLFKCLRDHPLISGFKDTGVPEDEGQHLQSVYPPAYVYGGAGRFGFQTVAHLTEMSPLVSGANREKLFNEWSRYWDTAKPLLLEKSPPNLIRTRFLQSLFPDSYFIIVLRHPVAVTLSTLKWGKRRTTHSLIKHWLVCHELFQEDCKYLNNLFVLKYEGLVKQPGHYLSRIFDFLGIENYPTRQIMRSDINEHYFNLWRKRQNNPLSGYYINYIVNLYEERVNRFGYSLLDLAYCAGWQCERAGR